MAAYTEAVELDALDSSAFMTLMPLPHGAMPGAMPGAIPFAVNPPATSQTARVAWADQDPKLVTKGGKAIAPDYFKQLSWLARAEAADAAEHAAEAPAICSTSTHPRTTQSRSASSNKAGDQQFELLGEGGGVRVRKTRRTGAGPTLLWL